MNKSGITLNLRTKTGKKILAELLKDAIFVENNPPKMMEELGNSYQTPQNINPFIIMPSITPFGETSLYKDCKNCESIIAHMGGAGYAPTREGDISQGPIRMLAHLIQFLPAQTPWDDQ